MGLAACGFSPSTAPGQYYINYTVSDMQGATSWALRIVTVLAKCPGGEVRCSTGVCSTDGEGRDVVACSGMLGAAAGEWAGCGQRGWRGDGSNGGSALKRSL